MPNGGTARVHHRRGDYGLRYQSGPHVSDLATVRSGETARRRRRCGPVGVEAQQSAPGVTEALRLGCRRFDHRPAVGCIARLPRPPGTGQRLGRSGGHVGEATAVEKASWRATGRPAGPEGNRTRRL